MCQTNGIIADEKRVYLVRLIGDHFDHIILPRRLRFWIVSKPTRLPKLFGGRGAASSH